MLRDYFGGNLWRSDFFGSGPGFVNRTQSNPGFVNPVRSSPGFVNPIRSGPARVLLAPGLKLNVKKTKALWLGKWRFNRTTPLQLSWPRDPVKILGIFSSYDNKASDHYNFHLKIQKLQTHLDMWSSRSLTLFGKVLIIKSLSQILYSASNTNVPKDMITSVKRKPL